MNGYDPSRNMLQRKLDMAVAKIEEYEQLFAQLGEQAKPLAMVVLVEKDYAYIEAGGGLIRIKTPKDKKLQAGDLCTILSQTGQVHEHIKMDKRLGLVATVKTVLNGTVELEGPQGLVAMCDYKVNVGDRVLCDRHYNAVLEVLGQAETSQKFSLERKVLWDQIGGNDIAKKALQNAIITPVRHAELYKSYGKKPVRGVLLSGPPGCGKTLLAQAAATELANLHGASGEAGFIYVKGPELLNRYVGESERNVRDVFDSARAHKRKHGHPAIIFLDEADAVLGKRDAGGMTHVMTATMVPAFLTEMDGLEDSGAIVLLATNRPDVLDPAVVRDGRVDYRVKVQRPSQAEVETIAAIHLRDRPIVGDQRVLYEHIASEIFRKDRILRKVNLSNGDQKRQLDVTLGDMVSGALVAGVVEHAITKAMERDIERKGKLSGISTNDITWAVDQMQLSQLDVDHRDVILDKMETQAA